MHLYIGIDVPTIIPKRMTLVVRIKTMTGCIGASTTTTRSTLNVRGRLRALTGTRSALKCGQSSSVVQVSVLGFNSVVVVHELMPATRAHYHLTGILWEYASVVQNVHVLFCIQTAYS